MRECMDCGQRASTDENGLCRRCSWAESGGRDIWVAPDYPRCRLCGDDGPLLQTGLCRECAREMA